MRQSHHTVTFDSKGLTTACEPALARFGRRSTGVIVNVPGLQMKSDDHGLKFFSLTSVFTAPTVFLGVGKPNSYLVIPTEDDQSTEKLAAFMFWRQEAAVVPTKDRVQAGTLFELTGLPEAQVARLRGAMRTISGTRSASCAHSCALALDHAGFRLGNGRRLSMIYRPSKLASLVWRHGLVYDDETGRHQVALRVIQASDIGIGEHFVGVWKREATAAFRAIEKQYRKRHPASKAPLFEPQKLPALDMSQWTGPSTTIGMLRSNRLGANVAFITGQKPVYVAKLPNLPFDAALGAFPVIDDKATWLKRHVLFSPLVVTLVNRSRLAATDWYDGMPSSAVVDMLKESPGADYAQAVLYNCVVRSDEMRVTGLHTDEERDQNSKLMHYFNWIAAKHVLLSNYDPTVVFACELWTYRNPEGQPVLCLNNNSGTYRPSGSQLEEFASYLRTTFSIQVETFHQ